MEAAAAAAANADEDDDYGASTVAATAAWPDAATAGAVGLDTLSEPHATNGAAGGEAAAADGVAAGVPTDRLPTTARA